MDGVPYVRICVQGEGTGWESAFPASLTGLWRLSGWSEGKCHGIGCNGVAYEENNKPIKKIKRLQ